MCLISILVAGSIWFRNVAGILVNKKEKKTKLMCASLKIIYVRGFLNESQSKLE